MPCIISDTSAPRTAAGALVATGLGSQQILAVPSSPTLTTDVGGTFYPLNVLNPGISGSLVYKYGVLAVTNDSGVWSITLPYGVGESHPASPLWSLIFPDGSILTGVVPAVAGPVNVDDLVETYGWTWASQVYVAPVTAGTFAKGTVSFTASSTASVVFLTPFVSNAYQVELTPSVDSGDGTLPRVGWSNKTTTGFDVVTDGSFTGSVDFTAQL